MRFNKAMAALACGVSTLALASAVHAQDATASSLDPVQQQSDEVGEIVVTGSRTVSNGNASPTPVTVVAVEQLTAATPSNIPDGLNKLPIFNGSRNATTLGNASSNNVGNFLNLRGFGIIRTLILQDGRRVPATNADGTTDTNMLPQMLVSRVDVVTGGASAVYGSDAVTGVVNFIINPAFEGLRVNAQAGVSGRGDAVSSRFGIAGGAAVGDGRLHVQGSYEHFQSDGLDNKFDREVGRGVYCQTGAGTAASPYVFTEDCRVNTRSYGGLIVSGPLRGMDFASNSVLTPFARGTATATATIDRGGDGAYISNSSMAAELETDQLFGRADYRLTDSIDVFGQVTLGRSANANNFGNYAITQPVTLSAQNAFLTPAQQLAASAGGATTFQLAKTFGNQDPYRIESEAENINVTIGAEGDLGDRFTWSAYYTYGQTDARTVNHNNVNQARLFAALDAVRSPTGAIVCNVTLTNPGLYPGCQPLNLFGPTAEGENGLDWVRQDTSFTVTNDQHDFGATIAGDIFEGWAGPIRAAVSVEYRRLGLETVSDALPSDRVDCTGIRFGCVADTVPLYSSNVVAPATASQSVAEGALEITAPLVVDAPFIDLLEINGAVRYADYSSVGEATTWKLGLNWEATPELRFRATRSRDIRAPTLNDLYSPVQGNITGFADPKTNTSAFVRIQTQGNPDLVPEVAETLTLGVVYRPSWAPSFSASLDYFDIQMDNAITAVSALNASTAVLCEASGGTSPLCSLFVRPLPFSDNSPANFPTLLLSQNLNVAETRTHGADLELNYGFDLADQASFLGGRFNVRTMISYQPVLASITIPGQVEVNSAGAAGTSKWRVTGVLSYTDGPLKVGAQTRWRDAQRQSGNPLQVFSQPDIPSTSYTDLNVSYDFDLGGRTITTFLSVENLFDKDPYPYANSVSTAVPNFNVPVVPGDDVIGRYFTTGVRMRF